MKPHVAAGVVQFVTQPVAVALAAAGFERAALIVEAVGGGCTAAAAYLAQQGE